MELNAVDKSICITSFIRGREFVRKEVEALAYTEAPECKEVELHVIRIIKMIKFSA